MSMGPPPKRSLRPTHSLPTTAETYGEKHGIPDEVQRRLQHIGARGRFAVSQGRAFERTQSFPAFASGNTFDVDIDDAPSAGPSTGFQTMNDIRQLAQDIVSREALRQRELQPYSHMLDADAQAAAEQGLGHERKLRFDVDGNVMMDDEHDVPAITGHSAPISLATGSGLAPSRKRRIVSNEQGAPAEAQAGSDTDTDTELDFDASPAVVPPDLSNSSTSADEFPAVFTSPQISQPQLFTQTPGLPAPRQLGRKLRGLPGAGRAMLGKTKSAPAGRLFTGSGMDVDEEGEDGFDVSEWAKGEDF